MRSGWLLGQSPRTLTESLGNERGSMQNPVEHSHPLDPELRPLLNLQTKNNKGQATSMKAIRGHIERLDENNVLIQRANQELCHKAAVVEVDLWLEVRHHLACWYDDLEAAPVPDGQFAAVEVASWNRNSWYGKGGTSVCALRTDDTAVCWETGGSVGPSPGGSFTSVDIAVRDSICALGTDGTPVCWNHNHIDPSTPTAADGEFIRFAQHRKCACLRSRGRWVHAVLGRIRQGHGRCPLRVIPVGQCRLPVHLRPEDRWLSSLLG